MGVYARPEERQPELGDFGDLGYSVGKSKQSRTSRVKYYGFVAALLLVGGYLFLLQPYWVIQELFQRNNDDPFVVSYFANTFMMFTAYMTLAVITLALDIKFPKLRLISKLFDKPSIRSKVILGLVAIVSIVALVMFLKPLTRTYVDWLNTKSGYVRCFEDMGSAKGIQASLFVSARKNIGCSPLQKISHWRDKKYHLHELQSEIEGLNRQQKNQ